MINKQEAIELLTAMSGNCIYTDEMEAFTLAIEALERLIPKPVQKTEERYGTPYWCPECEADQCKVHFITTDGSEPKEKVSYCWKCGRAIDWSEEK